MAKDKENNNSDGWLWVIVNVKDTDGHYLGLYDEQRDVDFIPAFANKDAANDCFLDLPREKGEKYEVQAVHIDELKEDADKAEFSVVLVDQDGKIIK